MQKVCKISYFILLKENQLVLLNLVSTGLNTFSVCRNLKDGGREPNNKSPGEQFQTAF